MKESQLIEYSLYFFIVCVFGLYLWRYFKKESFSERLGKSMAESTHLNGTISTPTSGSASGLASSCDIDTIVDLSGTDDCCENCTNGCSKNDLHLCLNRCVTENHSDPRGCGGATAGMFTEDPTIGDMSMHMYSTSTSTADLINVPEVSESLLV